MSLQYGVDSFGFDEAALETEFVDAVVGAESSTSSSSGGGSSSGGSSSSSTKEKVSGLEADPDSDSDSEVTHASQQKHDKTGRNAHGGAMPNHILYDMLKLYMEQQDPTEEGKAIPPRC